MRGSSRHEGLGIPRSMARPWPRRNRDRPVWPAPTRVLGQDHIIGVGANEAVFGSIGPKIFLITADSTNVQSIEVTM